MTYLVPRATADPFDPRASLAFAGACPGRDEPFDRPRDFFAHGPPPSRFDDGEVCTDDGGHGPRVPNTVPRTVLCNGLLSRCADGP